MAARAPEVLWRLRLAEHDAADPVEHRLELRRRRRIVREGCEPDAGPPRDRVVGQVDARNPADYGE